MPTFRCFVVKAENNENVRVFDFESDDLDTARLAMTTTHLEDGEAIDQVVQIAVDVPDGELTADQLEDQIARLQALLALRRAGP